MKIRRSHYELAFEALLSRRGVPFVAVEEVRHYVKGPLGSKTFDYIVYPAGAKPCLVDVKGRKIMRQRATGVSTDKNWVTRADLDGMAVWRHQFGTDYDAAFVFAYWLASPSGDGGGEASHLITFAGRRYAFWLTPVGDYERFQRQRSKRWNTVHVAVADFRAITRNLCDAWPAAPC